MAESSLFWDGNTYASNSLDDIFSTRYSDGYISGTIPGVGTNGYLIASSSTSSPVSIAAGAAWVNGKFYKNTAAINVAIPTPSTYPRIDRIVLRADYTAKAVTVQRLAGTESPTPTAPSLTQVDGTTWEASICQVYITTGGAITITPELTESHPIGAFRRKQVMFWAGSVSDHYLVDPRTGAVDYRWHLANGETVNGVDTPNLADRFLLAAGSTYSAGSSGGSATKDLSHTHGVGSLTTVSESGHTHGTGTLAVASESSHTHGDGTLATVGHNHSLPTNTGTLAQTSGTVHPAFTGGGYDHVHFLQGTTGWAGGLDVSGATGAGSAHSHGLSGSTGAGSAHSHGLSGASASGGSAAQDVLPPYYALYVMVYVGS